MAINQPIDFDLLEQMQENPSHKAAANKALATARQLAARKISYGPYKVFLSDLAEALDIPMKSLAKLAVHWNNLGYVQLTRADLVGAMDPRKVRDSEVRSIGSEFHFIVVPSH